MEAFKVKLIFVAFVVLIAYAPWSPGNWNTETGISVNRKFEKRVPGSPWIETAYNWEMRLHLLDVKRQTFWCNTLHKSFYCKLGGTVDSVERNALNSSLVTHDNEAAIPLLFH